MNHFVTCSNHLPICTEDLPKSECCLSNQLRSLRVGPGPVGAAEVLPTPHAAYLRGHAAALAVVLRDELVEEQVDLGPGGVVVIRAQGAEPGRQAAKSIALLRWWLSWHFKRRLALWRAGELYRRHLSYVKQQGTTSGVFPAPRSSSGNTCLDQNPSSKTLAPPRTPLRVFVRN